MVNIRDSPGFAEGWQRHHIIPKQCLTDRRTKRFFLAMSVIGFRVNDFTTNGILLPSTSAEAASAQLPLHSGPHPEYNAKMIDAIECIAGQFYFADDGGEALAALSQVRLVQARLRASMFQDRLTSVDRIDTPMIMRHSRVIESRIDRLVLGAASGNRQIND